MAYFPHFGCLCFHLGDPIIVLMFVECFIGVTVHSYVLYHLNLDSQMGTSLFHGIYER